MRKKPYKRAIYLLRAARRYLQKHGWTKGDLQDKNGCCCLEGAITLCNRGVAAYIDPGVEQNVADAIIKAANTKFGQLYWYNDAPSTTFRGIMSTMKKAEKYL